MLIGKSQVQVMIISEKYQEINNVIQTSLDRGSTFLQSITGHLQKGQLIVLSILSPRELPNLNRLNLSNWPDGLYDCYPSQWSKRTRFYFEKARLTSFCFYAEKGLCYSKQSLFLFIVLFYCQGRSVVPILQSICRWSGAYHREDSEHIMAQCQKCDYHFQ